MSDHPMVVYEVTCLADGQRYIGSATQPLAARWEQHLGDALNRSGAAPLHAAIRKHGVASFTVREIACARTVADLRAMERAIIAQEGTGWPSGFNAATEDGVHFTQARAAAIAGISEGVARFAAESMGYCNVKRRVPHGE